MAGEYIKGRFVSKNGFQGKISHIEYVEIDEEKGEAFFVDTDGQRIPYKRALDIFRLHGWSLETMIDFIESYRWVEYNVLIYDVGDIIAE